ncbi:phage tail assembly protein [Halomonas sp. MMSF_3323]|uniref:phage tail assembly protein n=1 Tax=Halomonas sp. MMSF_3323 TaxID=3046701 RepID=UPI00273FD467|nr:phage tail assembly protein [Halomonas sp. MMSF_3323]
MAKKTDVYSETTDITLSKGIDIDGARVQTITMREPTVADQLAVDGIKGNALREITFFANLCDLTPDDIKQLPLRDYRKLAEAFEGFTE